jgi:hypothetical protein
MLTILDPRVLQVGWYHFTTKHSFFIKDINKVRFKHKISKKKWNYSNDSDLNQKYTIETLRNLVCGGFGLQAILEDQNTINVLVLLLDIVGFQSKSSILFMFSLMCQYEEKGLE